MILFVVDARCGGAQRMTLLYAQILQEAGYDCCLLVIQRPSEKFELKSFIPSGLPYDLICDSKVGIPYKIYKYIHRLNPSCVFDSYVTITMALVRVWSKWNMPELKVLFRESNMPSRYSRIQLMVAKKCLRYVDVIISQTEEMKQEMVKYYALTEDRIIVINNPIDTAFIEKRIKEHFHFSFSDSTHYLAVGRVEPQKDYLTLLKAFSIVNKQYQKSRLHILGDYSCDRKYKKELDETIRNLHLEKVVYFEGFQSNPYKYIKAADVFVLSSIYEGLPNVLQEAMYLCKPVVATRCIPYIPQIVKDGINGYTVPIKNPEALAEAMLKATSLHVNERSSFDENEQRLEKITNLFRHLI